MLLVLPAARRPSLAVPPWSPEYLDECMPSSAEAKETASATSSQIRMARTGSCRQRGLECVDEFVDIFEEDVVNFAVCPLLLLRLLLPAEFSELLRGGQQFRVGGHHAFGCPRHMLFRFGVALLREGQLCPCRREALSERPRVGALLPEVVDQAGE